MSGVFQIQKVSVITVVKTPGPELEKTIVSLSKQTYSAIEFIIICGGTSPSLETLRQLHHSLIDVYVEESDEGIYEAMNKGVALAKGSWVIFMNSGDSFYQPETVERLTAEIGEDDEIVYGDTCVQDELHSHIEYSNLNKNLFFKMPICHQSMMVRKSLLAQHPFDTSYRFLADYDMVLRSYYRGNKFRRQPHVVSNYLAGGTSAKNHLMFNKEGMNLLTRIRDELDKDLRVELSSYHKELNYNFLTKTSISSYLASLSDRIHQRLHRQKNKGQRESDTILHITKSTSEGGAAKAALRLHSSLVQSGINSKMLTLNDFFPEHRIYSIRQSKWRTRTTNLLNRLAIACYGKKELAADNPMSTNLFGSNLTRNSLIREAGIIHLHWTAAGFLGLNSLRNIKLQNKKIIWTLHDMSPFTGLCHNPIGCERFIDGCGSCPLLESNQSRDLSSWVLKKKREILESSDIQVIAPSEWMAKKARASLLFRHKKISVLPNPLDTSFFRKIDQKKIVESLPFYSNQKTYIAFGAHNKSPQKGLKYFLESLNQIANSRSVEEVVILFFGAIDATSTAGLDSRFEKIHVGMIHSEITLRAFYSAIDIIVSPSLQESFGQVLTEAMACETVAVGFNYSGTSEIIEHRKTGYLAEYQSSGSLASGIIFCLSNDLETMKTDARLRIVENYDYSVVSQLANSIYQAAFESN